jgi:hypothetical protein
MTIEEQIDLLAEIAFDTVYGGKTEEQKTEAPAFQHGLKFGLNIGVLLSKVGFDTAKELTIQMASRVQSGDAHRA